MNKIEKYLAEQIGECVPIWKEHSEWNGVERDYYNVCTKCGKREYVHVRTNPFQQADEANRFFILWNWANRQAWWNNFAWSCLPVDHTAVGPKFAKILYNYLIKREKEK